MKHHSKSGPKVYAYCRAEVEPTMETSEATAHLFQSCDAYALSAGLQKPSRVSGAVGVAKDQDVQALRKKLAGMGCILIVPNLETLSSQPTQLPIVLNGLLSGNVVVHTPELGDISPHMPLIRQLSRTFVPCEHRLIELHEALEDTKREAKATLDQSIATTVKFVLDKQIDKLIGDSIAAVHKELK